jgi:hypothetical protein
VSKKTTAPRGDDIRLKPLAHPRRGSWPRTRPNNKEGLCGELPWCSWFAVAGALFAFVPGAGATIHPIVESFDCANAQASAHHPLGDPAEVPGQTPGDENPAGNQTGSQSFVALGNANANAFSDFKVNGECGNAP